jgi:hypothetical protein
MPVTAAALPAKQSLNVCSTLQGFIAQKILCALLLKRKKKFSVKKKVLDSNMVFRLQQQMRFQNKQIMALNAICLGNQFSCGCESETV